MIDLELYLLFIVASVFLGLVPGPNVTLIVANSIAHGTRYGLISVAGTSSAMVPQLTITVLGATSLLTFIASAFELVRWIGVVYLLYLGIRHLLAKNNADLNIEADNKAKADKKVYWRGFWVSATNPKTLLFFGAFLPQFVSAEGNLLLQLIVLSATFIVSVTLVDILWAVLAGKTRSFLSKFTRLRHRISGIFFILTGLGLALARR